METLEAINKRASLKTHLASREVEQDKIIKILEAARLAPSATNEQPWRFVVVKGKENVENVVTRATTKTEINTHFFLMLNVVLAKKSINNAAFRNI